MAAVFICVCVCFTCNYNTGGTRTCKLLTWTNTNQVVPREGTGKGCTNTRTNRLRTLLHVNSPPFRFSLLLLFFSLIVLTLPGPPCVSQKNTDHLDYELELALHPARQTVTKHSHLADSRTLTQQDTHSQQIAGHCRQDATPSLHFCTLTPCGD